MMSPLYPIILRLTGTDPGLSFHETRDFKPYQLVDSTAYYGQIKFIDKGGRPLRCYAYPRNERKVASDNSRIIISICLFFNHDTYIINDITHHIIQTIIFTKLTITTMLILVTESSSKLQLLCNMM